MEFGKLLMILRLNRGNKWYSDFIIRDTAGASGNAFRRRARAMASARKLARRILTPRNGAQEEISPGSSAPEIRNRSGKVKARRG